MAKITRIKASDPKDKAPKDENPKGKAPKDKGSKGKQSEEAPLEFSEKEAKALKKAAEKEKKSVERAERRKAKIEDREAQGKNKGVKYVLFAPFRYLRDSWHEIRQVRWPNRKATWKMVLAIFVYAALFVALIMLLDVFFTWLFNLILK